MKSNLDKRYIYAGALLIILIGVIGIFIALNQKSDDQSTAENTTELSTDISSEIPTETTTEATIDNDYFYTRPEGQMRVLAIKALDDSEIPVPYDFTQYGLNKYKDSRYYALVILEFEENQTTSGVSNESMTVVAELEIVSELEASHIEQVYNQMEIRYEEDYAIYQHDRKFFVTSLIEPKLYKNFVFFDLQYKSESTPETTTIGVYQSSFSNVEFSKKDKRFISKPITDGQKTEDYDWESKTVIHKPALTSVQGPSLSKITDEPRLAQLTLGASSAVLFDRLGQPKNVGWLSGYYLAYEELLFFSEMEENGDALTFHPTKAILYFGDFAVAGLKKGMTFKEVEKVIGPQDVLIFTEGNELNYPLNVVIKKEGFSISIGFNANFEVTQFLIRPEDVETGPIGEPLPNEVESAFSEDIFEIIGLEKFTDFTSGFNLSYFNASPMSSGGIEPIDIGFYMYDLSRQAPILVNDQPMYTVFEVFYDINPSIVTVGKEDGIIYKIDLNTFEATPVSGPNYKNHIAKGSMIIKASLLND